MNIQENISLAPFNSFGIDVAARFYSQIKNISDLHLLLKEEREHPLFILGGGSNMLLTQDLPSHVIHICNKGIEIVQDTETYSIIEIAAGENWHELVLWAIENNLGGIENLALIPGSVGAAPIQNIGAYGVELKDSFVSCKALHIESLKEIELNRDACKFNYRSSIFKTSAKGQYIILSIQLKLFKPPHSIKNQYGDINQTIEKLYPDTKNTTISQVAKAVIHIRSLKLPDPKNLGNSGSFFKNPILERKSFEAFRLAWPEAPFYELDGLQFKVPAGWLIEKAGLKGYREGAVGVHTNQALVLVNYGGASGMEVIKLAQKAMDAVFEKFNIRLEPEVNIIPAHHF